ncbi:MAG: 3-oxoacyl-ACP reductase FabG [Bacteroidota bacterium]|nr:3-oxoacyl-ACP reductase FabG [Bacteroidota bacterium]MDE2833446.1 3-oxoacyl-ACP reductase FabG [Bacteroidota bacterium]
MHIDLSGRVALVTGGGRDIGRAICLGLGEAGATVIVNYHASRDAAEDTVAAINKGGGNAAAVQADVTRPQEVERLFQEGISTRGGKLDILVNNAGGLLARKRLDEMDESFWDAVMDVNLKSVFLVTRAALPHMRKGGSIVNVGSLAARDGGGGGSVAYATAKGGVLTMTRGMAKELAERRIRVNCVSPGLINTTFHDTFTPDAVRKMVAGKTAVGREGESEDVARVVVFLASDAAAYINGESVEVNGGLYFS